MKKIITTLSAALKTDAARIYAMGGSNGAMFTHRLAAEMCENFGHGWPSLETTTTQGHAKDLRSKKPHAFEDGHEKHAQRPRHECRGTNRVDVIRR